MLLKNITNELKQLSSEMEQEKIAFFQVEKTYLEKRLPEDQTNLLFIEGDPLARFHQAYVERCEKETDELIAEETAAFLEKTISYFKEHLEEYMYLESHWFDMIGAEGVSFEVDSVFGTYDCLLGFKLPKKAETFLKEYFSTHLNQENGSFALIFNQKDGLWEINFSLNGLRDFHDDWTMKEAYGAIYCFLFQLAAELEAAAR